MKSDQKKMRTEISQHDTYEEAVKAKKKLGKKVLKAGEYQIRRKGSGRFSLVKRERS